MPKLKVLSGKDVIRIFLNLGFEIISQKGSHVKLLRFTNFGKQVITIPNHTELDKGTIKAIINQSSKYITDNDIYANFYTQ